MTCIIEVFATLHTVAVVRKKRRTLTRGAAWVWIVCVGRADQDELGPRGGLPAAGSDRRHDRYRSPAPEDDMEGLKIVRTTLTMEAASNIIETAVGSCGIGYWSRLVRVKSGKIEGSDDDHPIEIRIEDMEGREPLKPGTSEGAYTSPKSYRVTLGKIAKAVDAILKDPQGTEAVGWAERLVSSEFPDGPLADAIVQVACHGKVVYG